MFVMCVVCLVCMVCMVYMSKHDVHVLLYLKDGHLVVGCG